MTWFPNPERVFGWIIVLLATAAGWVVFSTTPLRAEDPESDNDNAPPREAAATAADARLDAHLQERELEAFERIVADFNADGVPDVAAHVALPLSTWEAASRREPVSSRSALMVVLGDEEPADARVAVEIPDGMLCPYCPIGSQEPDALPEQSLRAQDDGLLEVCESWGARWFVQTCSALRLDDGGGLAVERLITRTGWSAGPGEHRRSLDFLHLEGSRSYELFPLEIGYPVLAAEARFAIHLATYIEDAGALTLDGRFDDAPWRRRTPRRFEAVDDLAVGAERWDGPSDLSLASDARWTSEGLWLALDVQDDLHVPPDCADANTLLRSDHLELWFDLGLDPRRRDNDDDTEAFRVLYQEAPTRHEPDSHLFNLAVALSEEGTCTRQLLPRSDAEPHALTPIEASATPHEAGEAPGYRVEIFIPADFFGVETLEHLEARVQGIGMTIAAHDTDRGGHRDSVLATSTLRWGDPYSLGLLLMPRHPISTPAFPFDWSAWLGE